MPQLTFADLKELQLELAIFHQSHADEYGSMATCKQVTCVEVKIALEWLSARLSRQGVQERHQK